MLDTLLHHIGRKLVLREWQDLALHSLHDFGLVLQIAVFQDVLDDVVSVLILEELLGALMELFQHCGGLVNVAMLQDALDHAAAVRVG